MATTINVGRVAMVPKGDWDISTAYTRLDIVTHDGSSWICIQDSTGNEPAAGSTYWQLCAQGTPVDMSNYYNKYETDIKLATKRNVMIANNINSSDSWYITLSGTGWEANFEDIITAYEVYDTTPENITKLTYLLSELEAAGGVPQSAYCDKTFFSSITFAFNDLEVDGKTTPSLAASCVLDKDIYLNLGTTDTVAPTLPATYTDADEFLFTFTCATASCAVTLPTGVTLGRGLDFSADVAADRKFQFSIMDGIALYTYYDPN